MKNNQHFEIKIIQVDEGFAYDISILDDEATVAQYISELDAFFDEKVAPCLGCDLCCHQRIPLTLPDLYTYTDSNPDAFSAFIKKNAEIRTDGKAIDIKLRQKSNGSNGNPCLPLPFYDNLRHSVNDAPKRPHRIYHLY